MKIAALSVLSFLVVAATCLASAGTTVAEQKKERFRPDATKSRAEVPADARWDISPLFADDAAFDAALVEAAADRKGLASFRGRLASPVALRECLDLYFRARLRAKKLTLWSNLALVTDQRSSAKQARVDRAQRELAELMTASGFLRIEVMKIDGKGMEKALAAEPKLAAYRSYLEELRRRRSRVLSDEGEKLLGMAGDHLWAEIDLNEIPSPFERTYAAARADIALPEIADESGKKVRLTYSSYPLYRESGDRRVRREAVEALFGTLRAHENLFASTLAGEIAQHVFYARARGYDTAIEAYMDKDGLPVSVYRNLISGIHANLAPLHRYIRLRKKALGLDELRIYDLYPPLVPGTGARIPYDDAVRSIREALLPLGTEYGRVLATGLDPKNGWIDVYPHADKEAGAFSSFAFGVHPFVKTNYLETFNDVSTLAHEMGHALQQHLTMTKQPYPTSEFSLTLSEIPSTFNEKLLSDYLLRNAKNDEERLALLAGLVESLRTTIWRQALFAEFELAIATAVEQGTPVTADWLNATYGALVRTYYGPDFVMGENDAVEWASVPHFYYKFYTYAYALGLASGVALAERVELGGAPARDAFLAFLAAGNSKPPLEILRSAGVDLEKPDALDAAAKLMDRSIAEMERLLEKGKK
jgi:oligoendopeptidase F